MEKYQPAKIEAKWQKIWAEKRQFEARDDSKKPKYYCLDMFPYPSGEGLHVGHWRGYVLSDVWARYQILKGKNVLHPMGFDSFGLPAENAAIARSSHPGDFVDKAIKLFKKQLNQIGAVYDWSREIITSDPEYYKWTQWLFLKFYQAGLAYRAMAEVNFCPSCKTVLANEQVINGKCERCDSEVIKKSQKQWFFKITKYADRLLADLEMLDWPERTKVLQRNWIGKSKGSMIKFKIQNSQPKAGPPLAENLKIPVFTTRPDTLFGATYMVMAPEHELVAKITFPENQKEVEKYLNQAKKLSEIDRTNIDKIKTGVFAGAMAINPANNEKIPIWISDYVIKSYGTGAVMCVPAHDQRDFEFAKKFGLPIKQVITPDGVEQKDLKEAYTAGGVLINSEEFSGRYSEQAKIAITKWLEKRGVGKAAVSFRLRDWLISRQRYWGTPIPIIYCPKCGEQPVPEKNLPVLLPEDIDFKPTGKSPLERSQKFVKTTCPKCGGAAKRETDTMDTFVCSSWYYLRFADPKNSEKVFDSEKASQWLPVDFYVGGIEHAVLHLLYARFFSKVLDDLKIVNLDQAGEPFKKLYNIGMVYYQGAKMSKSKGNVVSPDDLIARFGTDALRGYELFMGPADVDVEWAETGIVGVWRFLSKVWKLYQSRINNQQLTIKEQKKSLKIQKELHRTIKKVSSDIENMRMNTAISALMEFTNQITKNNQQLTIKDLEQFVILMAPFFPHLAEELWQKLGHSGSVFEETWPEFDEKLAKEEMVTIVVQVNGKKRAVFEVRTGLEKEKIIDKAKKQAGVEKYLSGKKIKKEIYVENRLINFVV